jgi:hypothetical protein
MKEGEALGPFLLWFQAKPCSQGLASSTLSFLSKLVIYVSLLLVYVWIGNRNMTTQSKSRFLLESGWWPRCGSFDLSSESLCWIVLCVKQVSCLFPCLHMVVALELITSGVIMQGTGYTYLWLLPRRNDRLYFIFISCLWLGLSLIIIFLFLIPCLAMSWGVWKHQL